jgi:hypothetical protein
MFATAVAGDGLLVSMGSATGRVVKIAVLANFSPPPVVSLSVLE